MSFMERFGFEKSVNMYCARFVVAMFPSVLMLVFLPAPYWMAFVTGAYARLLMVCFIAAQFSYSMPMLQKTIDRMIGK